MKTEIPIRIKVIIPVTLCSLTPKNCCGSPGADASVSIFNEFTWLIERTVAAT